MADLESMLYGMVDELAPISPGEVRRNFDRTFAQIACLTAVVVVMAKAATAEQRRAIAAELDAARRADSSRGEIVEAWGKAIGGDHG